MDKNQPLPHVVIVGGGFGGLRAARLLGASRRVRVTILDKRNHHLFQPLLYQVATAGLSPAEIAFPIRSIVSDYKNVECMLEEVVSVDFKNHSIETLLRNLSYDYLILACGVAQSYFGHNEWSEFAPGLKSIEQATEIRRQILTAFEEAEKLSDIDEIRKRLTFVVVGGGPTGVELAGSIAELSRVTLSKDFRHIDPTRTRVLLIEASDRILGMFDEDLSRQACQDLEAMGVQIWTQSRVTEINADGVKVGSDYIASENVFWAAGVEGVKLANKLELEKDKHGRIVVNECLQPDGFENVFIIGDMCTRSPGLAPAAIQQGSYAAAAILRLMQGQTLAPFKYRDKGIMATIGRSKAVLQSGQFKLTGLPAWIAWLAVHIYFLMGFKNRIIVFFQWAWSYFTYKRGARIIIQSSPDA